MHQKFIVQLCLLIVLLLQVTPLFSQLGGASLKGPGMAVSVDYLPASRYIRPEDSVKTGSTTSQQRVNFGSAFLLSYKADTATGKLRSWSVSLSGSYTRLENKDYEKSIYPSELLGTEIGVQHYRSLNKKWTLLGLLSVGMYSDMERIDYNDLFINGGVVFIKKQNPKLSYGIGAVLTNSFGTPMVLPALVLQWKTGERYKIDVIFPEKLSISTSLNKQTDLALALRMQGAVYDVENRPDNKRLMGLAELKLGLENTWHLGRRVDFIASAGSTLFSNTSFKEKKLSEMFKDRPQHRLATNYFLSAGLRWNFNPALK
jgi:hypothetical protein